MDGCERRKFKRQKISYDISCLEVDSLKKRFYSGKTIDVGQGGLFFEIPNVGFETGDIIKMQLTIPPTVGMLEFGGRFGGFAKVLRIGPISDSRGGKDLHPFKAGVAVEFCRPLRLCM